MKRFILALLALSSVGWAGSYVPCPCQFEIGADYLYLQPLVDNTAYVFRTQGPGSFLGTRRFFSEFEANSGVHVWGRWGINRDGFLAGSWKRMTAKGSDRVDSIGNDLMGTRYYVGFGNVPPTPFEGFATSNLDLSYDDADLVYSHQIYGTPCFTLLFLGGVQYTSLDYKEDVFYSIVSPAGIGSIDYKTEFWGVGPKVGLDAYVPVPCLRFCGDLAFHGRATGAILVGESQGTFDYLETVGADNAFTLKNDAIWRAVPGAEMRLGLNLQRCVCRCLFSFEFGFDLIYYPGIIDTIAFTGDGNEEGSSLDDYGNLGFQGLYIGASLRF